MGAQCQKYSLSETSYQLGQCPRFSQVLYMGAILKSADPLDAFDRAIDGHVPTTVLCSRSGDKQWFYASCRRSYDAKQTTQIIGVDLCLLALRPIGSIVLHGSRIMNVREILCSTSPVHII